MIRVAVLISGQGSNMRALVASMTGGHPARPCLIVSNVAAAPGLDWAKNRGLPTAFVDHRPHGADRAAFEARLEAALTPYAPDILCLAGFMRIFSASLVERWQGRVLNIHPSLLPKYRGLDTHARALAAGESEHGCSVHEVTAELDAGPILGQARIPIHASDTPTGLAKRVRMAEHRLYPAVLRRFVSGERTPLFL